MIDMVEFGWVNMLEIDGDCSLIPAPSLPIDSARSAVDILNSFKKFFEEPLIDISSLLTKGKNVIRLDENELEITEALKTVK